MNYAKLIDHTLLKADATSPQIEKICSEALEYDFASVCVNPCHVKKCALLLKGSNVKVCTVIGFPLGANTTDVKVFETQTAIKDGATEIDMVINVGSLKEKNYNLVLEDMRQVKLAAKDLVVKVILETCLLTKEEIVKACELAVLAKLDFVKTSTGFSTGGATVEDVKLMKLTVGNNAKVKASGGVRTSDDMNKMVEAGADRIGTSNGIALIKNEKTSNDY